ncbi:MAG: ABC transporter ATP-binding protein [Fuerstiella sp.]|nr:ABC transporter ATP-binding protein [Fuerstiella sp.]MCP4858802.1 ABC transporter ATP-binding protein [Fuerstiella sp.]
MSHQMIELVNLSRSFGANDGVHQLSLNVQRGTTLGLLGMNGAGKSTTLRMLMGLLRPDSGEARIDGLEVIRHGSQLRRRIGYVPERPTVYSWMRVSDAMQFCRQLQPSWNDSTADELLRVFRLDSGKRVQSLSKGMATKLHLLLALAHEPATLILDEPLAGLDPVVRDEFIDGVLAGICERNCTVVFSSHQIDDVQRLSDAVAIIHEGRLLLEGETQTILTETRKVRVTLETADMTFIEPAGTIRSRRNHRTCELTLHPCESGTTPAVRCTAGVVDVEVEALSLEDLFKDVVLGAEAAL